MDHSLSKTIDRLKLSTLGQEMDNTYHSNHNNEVLQDNLIIVCDSGCSQSMMKASLVKDYRNLYFDKDLSIHKTAAGSFTSRDSMQISSSLNDFGGYERIDHQFDLDENDDRICYDIIISRDLMNK